MVFELPEVGLVNGMDYKQPAMVGRMGGEAEAQIQRQGWAENWPSWSYS